MTAFHPHHERHPADTTTCHRRRSGSSWRTARSSPWPTSTGRSDAQPGLRPGRTRGDRL